MNFSGLFCCFLSAGGFGFHDQRGGAGGCSRGCAFQEAATVN